MQCQRDRYFNNTYLKGPTAGLSISWKKQPHKDKGTF